MDKKKRLIVATAVGFISFLSLIGYLKVQRQRLLQESDLVSVLVAKKEIRIYTQLEEDMLSLLKVPKKYLQPGAVSNYADAVGQVVSTPILEGEQIVGTKLVTYGSEVGLST